MASPTNLQQIKRKSTFESIYLSELQENNAHPTEQQAVSFGTVLYIKGRLAERRHSRYVARLIAVKKRWKKIKLLVSVRNILDTLHRYVIEKINSDPSGPLYYQMTNMDSSNEGNLMTKISWTQFDASYYKADRQMRTSQEVRRILTLPPAMRSEEEIYCAMIGLRAITTIAEYPIRMQKYLAQYGTLQCFESKRVIILQGRVPEAFYFVLYGKVMVAVGDEVTGQVEVKCYLQRGHFFGELAIIQSSFRQSSVMTTCYTELLSLSSDIFQQYFMVGGVKNLNDPDHSQFLKSLPFLDQWPVTLILGPTDNKNVTFGYFKRGCVIVKDSNFSDWLIIVKSGSVSVMKKLVKVKPELTNFSPRYDICRSTDCDIVLNISVSDNWPKVTHRAARRSTVTCMSRRPAVTSQPSGDKWTSLQCSSGAGHSDDVKNETTQRPLKTKDAKKHRKAASIAPSQDVRDEKITFLEYLDSAFNDKPPGTTEADLNPQFVVVHTLTKGSVFGLAHCLFTNQPSLSVVSNGADCILLSKNLFLSNCSSQLTRRLRTEVVPYPSDDVLQDNLVTRTKWDAFKKFTLTQLYTQHRKCIHSTHLANLGRSTAN